LGPPRFAVIGCGAIAEAFYLPTLTERRDLCSALWIVDANPVRLKTMSQKFQISTVAASLEHVLDQIDVGVVATPHDTHFPISMQLIAAGKHVLCEKPITSAVEEAETMVKAAERAGVMLMPNNWRRNAPASREIKRIIETGTLGPPVSAAWTEGKKFDWPTKSGFYFTQKMHSKLPPPGVLLDIGAHTVDLFCWWFGSNPEIVECKTDSFGGPEARATLLMNFAGVATRTELSYYQKLVNTYNIQFERGSIAGGIYEQHFTLYRPGRKPEIIGKATDFDTEMIVNFVGAVAGRNPLLVTGHDVLPSVRAISTAYETAQRYEAPWLPGAM
jgi:predicted dehydrogenase